MVGVFSRNDYICPMNFRFIFSLAVMGWLLVTTPVSQAASSENPYTPIVTRNVFGLVPIPVGPPPTTAPATPPPKITPNGIMTIFGKLQALFKVAGTAKPGQPAKEESYIMGVGERQDDIEVQKIDEKAAIITFNNHGTIQKLPLIAGTATGGEPAPAPGGLPGLPMPRSSNVPPPSNGASSVGFGGRFGHGQGNPNSAAAGARRMVYVSSAHVYGALAGHIDETMPANPLSDYALAHYLAEQIFRRHAAATRILRPCAVFGPLAELQRFRRWSLIPFSFPRAIAESGVIRILGTGRDRRNFVGTDVVGALAADFIEMQITGVTLLNAVGTADLTVAEFAELCARLGGDLLGRSCRVEIAGKGDSAAPPPLEYRSVMGGQRNGRSLETHIVELVRQCSQLGATA